MKEEPDSGQVPRDGRKLHLHPDVSEMLEEMRLLETCGSAFEAEGIDIEALSCLVDGNLQALGVSRLGDRKKLVDRAKAIVSSSKFRSSRQRVRGSLNEEEPRAAAASVVKSAAEERGTECRKPWEGWGEWKENEGLYKGHWIAGKPHGQGKYVWTSGVRYEGEWYGGEPHGIGKWDFDRAGGNLGGRNRVKLLAPREYEFKESATDDAQASGYDIAVPPEGLPEQMEDDKGAGGMAVAGFRLRKAAADLERVARNARLWWPNNTRNQTDDAASDEAKGFLKRVLKDGSKVRIHDTVYSLHISLERHDADTWTCV